MNRIMLERGPLDGIVMSSPTGDNPAVGSNIAFDLPANGDVFARTVFYQVVSDSVASYTHTRIIGTDRLYVELP
jgi:hypothetical protein